MENEVKRSVLFLVVGVIAIIGVFLFFRANLVDGSKDFPKFNEVKIINKVEGYIPEIYLNEDVKNVELIDVVSMQFDSPIAIPKSATITKVRLVLKDERGREIRSKEKAVYWEGSHANRTEVRNILGDKFPDINVIMEKDISNPQMVVITIQHAAESEAATLFSGR